MPGTTPCIPRLDIFDPAGNKVSEPSRSFAISSHKEDTASPMFKCGNQLCIVTGDDYYPLPKEMDISHWGADYGSIFSYTQLPAKEWPPRLVFDVPAEEENKESAMEVDKTTQEDDYLPMTAFQVYPQASPPAARRPTKSMLMPSASNEGDISEFIQSSQAIDETVPPSSPRQTLTPSTSIHPDLASHDAEVYIDHGSFSSLTPNSMQSPIMTSSKGLMLSKTASAFFEDPSSSQSQTETQCSTTDTRSEEQQQTLEVSVSDMDIDEPLVHGVHELESVNEDSPAQTSSQTPSATSLVAIPAPADGSPHVLADDEPETTQTQTQSDSNPATPDHSNGIHSDMDQSKSLETGTEVKAPDAEEPAMDSQGTLDTRSGNGERGHSGGLAESIPASEQSQGDDPKPQHESLTDSSDRSQEEISSDNEQASSLETSSAEASLSCLNESAAHADESDTASDDPQPTTPKSESPNTDDSPSPAFLNDADGSASMPALSPDNDNSFMADTTIGTIYSNPEDVLYNGSGIYAELDAEGDTDSEESDSGDEDRVHLFPTRLLTYTPRKAIVPLPKSQPAHPSVVDLFGPPIPQSPKTPKRPVNPVLARCRSSTEPLRKVPTPPGSSNVYAPPGPLVGPFFQHQVSDIRRAGSAEPPTPRLDGTTSDLTSIPDTQTPSREVHLHILANAASDAVAEGYSTPVPTEASGQWRHDILGSVPVGEAAPATEQGNGNPFSGSSPLTSVPSPSEAIWNKGSRVRSHHAIPTSLSKPAIKGTRKFVAPSPLAGTAKAGGIRTVEPGPSHGVGLPDGSNDKSFSAALKPSRRSAGRGYGPVSVVIETVQPRRIQHQRSPSPMEPEASLESIDVGVDDLKQDGESLETVDSAASSLMGRDRQSSLVPTIAEQPVVAPIRGRGSGRPRGSRGGRGAGRGRGRSSSIAARPSPVKTPSAPIKRKAPVELPSSPPPTKKPKATRGRPKTVTRIDESPAPAASESMAMQVDEPKLEEELPFPPVALAPSESLEENGNEMEVLEEELPVLVTVPTPKVIGQRAMSTRGQPRSVSTESIAAMPLPEVEGETERERSQQTPPAPPMASRTRSKRAGTIDVPAMSPTSMDDAEGSPDPLYLGPEEAMSVEVKQEALDGLRDSGTSAIDAPAVGPSPAQPESSKVVNKLQHKRFYTDAEMAIVYTSLGPYPGLWDRSIKHMQSICDQLEEAGFMQRSAGGMKVKVRDMAAKAK